MNQKTSWDAYWGFKTKAIASNLQWKTIIEKFATSLTKNKHSTWWKTGECISKLCFGII